MRLETNFDTDLFSSDGGVIEPENSATLDQVCLLRTPPRHEASVVYKMYEDTKNHI